VSILNESSYSEELNFQCGELFGNSERCYVAGARLIFFLSYVNWLSCLSFDFCVYKPLTLSSLFMPHQDNKSGIFFVSYPLTAMAANV
jgi:hypothetical protein